MAIVVDLWKNRCLPLTQDTVTSCRSYTVSSGRCVGSFSSCSAMTPQNLNHFQASSVSCRSGPRFQGLSSFGSRSVIRFGSRSPRIVAVCPRPIRYGVGFGSGGGMAFGFGDGSGAGLGFGASSGLGYGFGGPGFGYRVGGAGVPAAPSITAVTVNQSLLTPLSLEIDPDAQRVKDEKEQIETLNNKFASFIDKVWFLDQQNKLLETKWNFLQEQKCARSNLEPLLENDITNLRRQLGVVNSERARPEAERNNMQDVRGFQEEVSEEVGLQASAENEFVALKRACQGRQVKQCTSNEHLILPSLIQDVDTAFLNKSDLEAHVDTLTQDINFLKTLCMVEIQLLQSHISETSVIVKIDNSRDLNFDGIIADIKAQYEEIARRSRADAEAWYQTKYEEKRVTAGQHCDNLHNLHNTRDETNELTRQTEKQRNIGIKGQRCKLEAAVAEAEQWGEAALSDAKCKLAELEAALQQVKQDMARHLKEYQGLMNVKLALDIKIATYKHLLEGEESRIYEGIGPVDISVSSSWGGLVCGPEPLVTTCSLSRGGVTISGRSSTRSSGFCSWNVGGAQVVGGGDPPSAGFQGGESVLVGETCALSVPCPLPTEGGFSSRGSSVHFVSTTTSNRAPASHRPGRTISTASASVPKVPGLWAEGALGEGPFLLFLTQKDPPFWVGAKGPLSPQRWFFSERHRS
ncbi:PREDICTED: LOW QUALITY PROTEIN: keratin, type II cuticular Hb4 [Lipotes vexillifer]|uniref:LOW QUALITY PROTEIN: keratin, type II cuticular Hb4 n=1 Tax=Lipotes vexillifer TaxID=118797 RepID=A0A340WXP3_LIPVE|nr:PREDICTED: LOW QUALITY PROTEIN: keratin, type II cuticular Hb4 [Lipotes vexillifer]